jgi:phytoene dehydrogenase-like protein
VSRYDAVVVGSGPNGLAAAITLAQAGLSVLVREGRETVGGGTRSAELTLPGFVHDVCSAVHPMAACSPFFATLPLAEHGLDFIHPPAPLAHPLDGGQAVMLETSLEATAAGLGADGDAYRRLIGRTVRDWELLSPTLLGPVLRVPEHPLALARFGLPAARSATGLASTAFSGEPARALFAGAAAHSILALEQRVSASFGLVMLALAHVGGWPIARGGSQRIADALVSYLRTLGGEVDTGAPVESLDALPPAETVLCDVGPRQLIALAGSRFPARYRRALTRYRYGPGVFKVDYALDAPVPWEAAGCARAGTLHLGGTLSEIAASERAPWRGEHAERPYVLVAQPSLFDPARAPEGRHTLWAYCHVPSGSSFDMTERVEAQLERFAPGFRDRVLARSVTRPADFERDNPNLVGGDITGGVADIRQLLARPTLRRVPYATPIDGVYLCSASTPPGGAVHGMCGHLAARAALRRLASRVTRRPDPRRLATAGG